MVSFKAQNWLRFKRVARFGDIDPAGVIHFYHLFRWCHETWEASLDQYELDTSKIFPASEKAEPTVSIALPIVHCEADFFYPIRLHDELLIELLPSRLNIGSFQVQYKFQNKENIVAMAVIKHRAINSKNRSPCNLPEGIDRWLEASVVNQGISSL